MFFQHVCVMLLCLRCLWNNILFESSFLLMCLIKELIFSPFGYAPYLICCCFQEAIQYNFYLIPFWLHFITKTKANKKRNVNTYFILWEKPIKGKNHPRQFFFNLNWQEILFIKLWKPSWDLHTRISKLVLLMQCHSRIHWISQGKLAVNVCFGI